MRFSRFIFWVGAVLFLLWPILRLVSIIVCQSHRCESASSFIVAALAFICTAISALLGANVRAGRVMLGFIIILVAGLLDSPAAHRDMRNTYWFPFLIGVDIIVVLALVALIVRNGYSGIKNLVRYAVKLWADVRHKSRLMRGPDY